jgi:two-component system, response regulator PdtaR
MSATAMTFIGKQQPIWKPTIMAEEAGAISPLLDLGILQTNAKGAYLYRFDRPNGEAVLIAFAGPAPENSDVHLGKFVSAHWNRKTPVVLRSHAASDWRFAGFPEIRSGRFDGVVSVPLLDSGEAVGLANFCLKGDEALSGSAVSFLMNLSLPLGALLAASTLRRQLEEAQQQLADRKIVERAKGILQARFAWTEEEAYLRMRRQSRRSRTPLREIAGFVIESGVELQVEAFE